MVFRPLFPTPPGAGSFKGISIKVFLLWGWAYNSILFSSTLFYFLFFEGELLEGSFCIVKN
jgi:hypothetical protein